MTQKGMVEQLAAVLQDCGTDLRGFTPTALSRDALAAHQLLNLMGDPEMLSDEGYRMQLAADLPAVARLIVDRISSRRLRLSTDAALALHPRFHGMLVHERKTELLHMDSRITPDVFREL